MLKSTPILFALALAATAGHAADNCDALRAKIEAQIAGTGVTGFTLTTVDVAADVPGKVVGTCGLGAKKIVYARSSGPAARPAAPTTLAPAQAALPRPRSARKTTRDADILTECRDGTVSMGGNCKN